VFVDYLENSMSDQLVQIKITSLVSTSRYGSLSPGDKLWTDAAYAKHLVEECGAGKYVDQQDSEGVETTNTSSPNLAQKAWGKVKKLASKG
jgi:hypothetical protein